MSALGREAHKGHLYLPKPRAIACQASSLVYPKAIHKFLYMKGWWSSQRSGESGKYLLTAGQELEQSYRFCRTKAFHCWSLAALYAKRGLSLVADVNFQTNGERVCREESANQGLPFENGSAAFNSLLKYEPAKSRCWWTERWVWWGGLGEERGFSPDGGLLKNVQCRPNKVVPKADGGTPRTSTRRKNYLLSSQREKWNSYSEPSGWGSSHGFAETTMQAHSLFLLVSY